MLIFAHRGLSSDYPENTLLAFEMAFQKNIDGVEFDVQLTKDNIPVVFHDFKLNRIFGKKGYMSDYSYNELKNFNLPRNQHIPSLEEVLNIIPAKVMVNIELKGKNTAEVVFETIENYVKKKKLHKNNLIISSFNLKELKTFYNLSKGKYKLGIIFESFPFGFLKFAKKIDAYSINPSIYFTTKKLVEKAHKNGLKVFVWTVNNPKNHQKAETMKVDGIFSDNPSKLKFV